MPCAACPAMIMQGNTPPETKKRRAAARGGTMIDEKIARINELAKKMRETGLDDAEKAEQAALRNEYVAAMRHSLQSQLENALVTDENGEQIPLRKKTDPKNPS